MELLSGGDILIRALKDAGVKDVWGYPGGAALHIYDALYRQDDVFHILVRHEQAAVHAADGFSRATGEVGTALVPLYCESFRDYFYSMYIERLDLGIDNNDINYEIVENQNNLSEFKFSINLNSDDCITLIDNCQKQGDHLFSKFNFIITLDNGNTYKLISYKYPDSSDTYFRYIYFNDELLSQNKVYNIKFSTEYSDEQFNIISVDYDDYQPLEEHNENYLQQKNLILSQINRGDSYLKDKNEDDVNRALATVGFPYNNAQYLLIKEAQLAALDLEYTTIEISVPNIIKIDIFSPIPGMHIANSIQDRHFARGIPDELKQLYKIIGMTDDFANFQMGIQLQHNNLLANKIIKQDSYKNIEEIKQKINDKLEQIQHIKGFESMDINSFIESFISGNVHKKIDEICSDNDIGVGYNISGDEEVAGLYQISELPFIGSILAELVPTSAGVRIQWIPVFLISSKYISDIIYKVTFKEEKVAEIEQRYKVLAEKTGRTLSAQSDFAVHKYKSSVQFETDFKTKDITSYFDKFPDSNIKEYFQQLQQDSIKKTWSLTSQEDIEKIITEISKLSIEQTKTNKGGRQWAILRQSPNEIYAYQREHTSLTNSFDSIFEKEWFIAPPNKKNVQNNILDNYENKLEIKIIKQELNHNQKLNLLMEKFIVKYAVPDYEETGRPILHRRQPQVGFRLEPMELAEKLHLPSLQYIEVTAIENFDLQPILNFINLTETKLEPSKENILKVLLFYRYLQILVSKLETLYNDSYLKGRRKNLETQSKTELQSDVDIIKTMIEEAGGQNAYDGKLTFNPFRYEIDMISNRNIIELNDSNWWINSNSNTIKFLKTFFLNHGLNERTNEFFQLSKQLPLINLYTGKKIHIWNYSKSVTTRLLNIPEIYKHLEFDIDKVYYKNSTLCDHEISPELIWTADGYGID